MAMLGACITLGTHGITATEYGRLVPIYAGFRLYKVLS